MAERKTEGDVKIRISEPSDDMGLSLEQKKARDEVMVVITQAFCPKGHNLIRREDVLFDGHPGISLLIDCGEWRGEVVLSPIHGDHSKVGANKDVKVGTNCTLMCPECNTPLPKIGDCSCESKGDLVALYLRPDLREGEFAAICTVMGCYHSRVLDHFEVLSEFIARETEE